MMEPSVQRQITVGVLLWSLLHLLPIILMGVDAQRLAAGFSQSCVIGFDQAITCWGYTNSFSFIPSIPFQELAPPISDHDWIQIDSCSNEVCALRSNGTGMCFGNSSTPILFDGPYIEIRSGEGFACGKFNNLTLDCFLTWEDNSLGELDVDPNLQFTSFDVGYGHGCGILINNSVTCWGTDMNPQQCMRRESNENGLRLTRSRETPPPGMKLIPLPVLAPNEYAVQVSIHTYVNCMVLNTQAVRCWGDFDVIPENTDSCRGLCSFDYGDSFQVAAAEDGVCVLLTSGSSNLLCVDSSIEGFSNSPTGIFTEIAAGTNHVCALRSDNIVLCWGIGPGIAVTPISLARGPCTMISANTEMTCLVCPTDTEHPIHCWVSPTMVSQAFPGRFQMMHFTPQIDLNEIITDLKSLSSCSCWLSTEGRMRCFPNVPDFPPLTQTCYDDFEAPGQPYRFQSIHPGSKHMCGLLLNSTVRCFGRNDYNQSYVPGLELLQFETVSAGYVHTCGILLDTKFVYCWGSSDYNRLVAPVNVSFGGISTGFSQTCGVLVNGSMSCFGNFDPLQPAVPLPGSNWDPKSIECDKWEYVHCCLRDNTTHIVSCTGFTDFDESTPKYSFPPTSPQEYLTQIRVKQIAVGWYHTCIIMEDPTLEMNCFGGGLLGPFTMPAVVATPNQYQQNNQTLTCPAGTYSVGRPAITPLCNGLCSPGRYAAEGSDSQLIEGCGDICPIGFYCPIGSGQPLPCPENTYSFLNGSSYCTPCAPPQQVYQQGTLCGLRSCPPATHPQGDLCTECGVHQYSSGNTSSCLTCPPHMYVTNNCDLSAIDPSTPASCSSCDQISGVDCSNGFPIVQSSYWGMYNVNQFSPSSSPTWSDYNATCQSVELLIYDCPGQFCSGTVDPSVARNSSVLINPCDVNRISDPSNLLCRSCVSGMVDWYGSCMECNSTNWGILFLFYLCTLIFVLFLHLTSQTSSASTNTFLYFVQNSLVFVDSLHQNSTFAWLLPFNLSFLSTAGGCLISISPIIQKWVPVFTILILFFNLILISIGSYAILRLKQWRLQNQPLDDEEMIPSVDSSNQLSSNSSLDPSTYFFRSSSTSGPHLNPYIRTSLAVLLFSYLPASIPCFEFLFQCVHVGSERLLFSVPTLSCRSTLYQQLFVPAIILVTIIILLPIGLFIFLWRHHAHIKNNDHHFRSRYGILFESYHHHTYYYGVSILVRRLILTLMDTIFYDLKSMKYLLFSLANLIFLAIHIRLRPMKDKDENQLETFSLFLLLTLTMLVLSLPVETNLVTDRINQRANTIIAIKLLIILPTCLFIVWMIRATYLKYQHHMKQFLLRLQRASDPEKSQSDSSSHHPEKQLNQLTGHDNQLNVSLMDQKDREEEFEPVTTAPAFTTKRSHLAV